jgi:glycine/serine hydroxymethyltransferase
MKEEEMKLIARILKESVVNKDNEEKLKSLKKEVLELCKRFPIYRID